MAAVALSGVVSVADASPSASAAAKKHHKHHKKHHHKKKKKKKPTTSFKGCTGNVLGTVTETSPPYPYVVRFVCSASSNFSSFTVTLNRPVSSVSDPRGDWNCSPSSSGFSCTSLKGPFNFTNDDPNGIAIGLNVSSTQTPCGAPTLSGSVTPAGDTSSISLPGQPINCP